MNEGRARDLFKNEESHPVALDKALNELYPDWVVLDSEATLALLRSIVEGGVGPYVRNKVNALKTVHSSEAPWEDWEVFQWVCQSFADQIADFSNVCRLELGDLFVGVDAINTVRKMPFSDEVSRWVAADCLDLGLVWVPRPLNFANKVMGIADYRCLRCGNIDLDEDNKKCDRCHAPESFLIKQYKYMDPTEVEQAWKTIQNIPVEQMSFKENELDVHLAKLVAARVRAGERRDQLKQELKYVESGG
jgi:ribosomal protein L37E